ncbi:MAG: hypothetical protein SGI88_06120, partial [Candidatus Hydrogenedentes bacterium]|nr:hypothetical protein [Candidatus Hydrogenedentota bacterium]
NIPIRARYAVSAVVPPNLTANDTAVSVQWTFQEDGNLTQLSDGTTIPFLGPFTSNSDVRAIFAPGFPINTVIDPLLFADVLGDPNRRRAVPYLFTASAFYVKNGAAAPTTDDVTIIDPTPAIAYFVVVPAGVGDFVMSPEDAEKQPFKEQGIE